ncbi:MAG: P-loop NTPase [Peptococcaceae bacterium]|nr:P-loop NTPase [Peptococcaceae bacterium]
MREIVVLSGKGGTGKTSLTGASTVLGLQAVWADCDVDAANLHLLLNPEVQERVPFYGGKKPAVNKEECSECGLCTELCRYDAIKNGVIDELNCERCALCYHVCPEKAISLEDELSGHIYRTSTPYGPFIYAELGVAQENSGKLVSQVKQHARELARKEGSDYIIVDGPPGVGCPVIASISGAHLALIVTEPTMAGQHDLERIVQLAGHFSVPVAVVINKWDLDEDRASEMESICRERDIDVVGKIPFERKVVAAQVNGVASLQGAVYKPFAKVWERVLQK